MARIKGVIALSVMTLCTCAVTSFADVGVDTQSSAVPVVPAVYASVPPVIDGMLDDPIWRSAPRLDDFHVVELNSPPVDSTHIYVLYDSSYVYFAARCFDHRPDLIAIEETKRGGNINNDDHLSFNLDLTNQRRVASSWYFKITAGGVQSELVPGGSASKTEWRGDWLAQTLVDSLGWTAEVAIPVELLGASGSIDTAGIYVDRWVPRYQEWAAWPNMGLNYDLERTGRLVGLRLPRTTRRVRVMPYVVGESDNGNHSGYLGVDMKHTLRSGITLAGTANPDHRNIETEVLGLGFSYGERFRADNRPFFVEGGKFTPDSRLFYSQRVGVMYAGVKAFGTRGPSSYGVIASYDTSHVRHVAARWFRQPSTRTQFDQSVVWRHSDERTSPRSDLPATRSNLTAESRFVGTLIRGRATDTYETRAAITHTADTVGTGAKLFSSYTHAAGNGGIGGSLSYGWTSADWLPLESLFDPELRNLHTVAASLSYSVQMWSPRIRAWSLSTSANQSSKPDGEIFARSISASGSIESEDGIRLSGGPSYSERGIYEDRSFGATIAWNIRRLYTTGSASASAGTVQGTDFTSASVSQGFHPLSSVTLQLSGQSYRRVFPVGHLDEPAGGTKKTYQLLTTMQIDITTEHALTGRVINSRDGTNAYVTYRQVVRSGVDLFVIVGDPSRLTWSKRVAVKAMVVL
jgi:hypothetical protein